MPYAILRFQKRKAGGVAACERHNERKKEAYKSNPDIDMERSKNNYHLVAPPKYTYKKEINRKVAEAGCRTRKDSVMMVETLITASPEFMNQLPPEEQKAYFTMALDFISERVGEQNILSAVVHMDERTPHMHLCFVSSPASRYTCFPARCWSLGCPGGDNLTRIASWRTHRMARRKRNVSDLPYAAPPLSCAAFFVKVQNGFAAASAAERKRGREKASRRCGLFLCLKGEDSHHQFCLQPFPNVVVYAKMTG